jgi:RHH-type proline utilization regulon transcriptional repressor/proline dehydrogenase/delta 1-pyrroline-5-carboxylate dehydrogenase
MDKIPFLANARKIIDSAKNKKLSVDERCKEAIELTHWMLKESQLRQTDSEKKSQEHLAKMMADPNGKVFTTSMTDQCFRSQSSRRVVDQLVFLLKKFGIPRYLSPVKRFQLGSVKWMGKALPQLVVPLFKRELRNETMAVILPGEKNKLRKHILKRNREGVRVNLNHLGEAILGEKEAKKRLDVYLDDLTKPEVECISVKISTICSQINLLAWNDTVAILENKLGLLYQAAIDNPFKRKDGEQVSKFVYLDMEEYRDLHLTVALFEKILNKPEFFTYTAGIVLQSYLPDSHLLQKELTAWAMQRVTSGGAPIKIRIVKGANLSMEKVEASMKGWEQAPYATKADVDGNFKRMVHYGTLPNHAKAVKIGVGSHNLFDISYAMLLRAENGVESSVGFEMLEGMADHIRRVVQELTSEMLLYCPSATEEEFVNAVAYLMRRLDENTAPNNFLRHLFDMSQGTKQWDRQVEEFTRSCKMANEIEIGPRRKQNRLNEPLRLDAKSPFQNEADTDWSLPQNRTWALEILSDWSKRKIPMIPLVIGGKEYISSTPIGIGIDPSDPTQEFFRYQQADLALIEKALETASKNQMDWSNRPVSERVQLVKEIGQGVRENRGELIGAMLANTGKIVTEADAEVSEAVDFAEYYSRNMEEWATRENIDWKPKGTILVAPPWNFPCAIPLGGIVAALTTGNCVLFKPSPEAVLVGWILANICWKAGISKEVLQFIPCQDDPVGSELIKDSRINGVVLTGATSTAKMMLKLRPGLNLMAETGGKNMMVITNMSDRDLAIREIIHSAFSHSGQKCSACSIAVCLPEVYDDPHFKDQLRDAAESLVVGSQWNLATRINPLIREPGPTLRRGLTHLDTGEQWVLKPKQDPNNPQLWSPGIKWGVKPGSFTHQNEMFGPVLGVIRAKNLQHAMEIVNGTPYGLTSGIQTLDEREQKYWVEHVQAGNLYVNRGITGAIVRRQPFGGCKESSFGPGFKAGGPNYLLGFMTPLEKPDRKETYEKQWTDFFNKDLDESQILGQDNFLKYIPQTKMAFRIQSSDNSNDIERILKAAKICGTHLDVSDCNKETEDQFIKRIGQGAIKRVRMISAPSEKLKIALAEAACNIIEGPVVSDGRIELTHYLRELSVSIDYHRYGNLGVRE